MIRKFSLSLKDANVQKTAMLREFHAEAATVINYYITKFFPCKSLGIKSRLLTTELDAPTWLSKRAQKNMARQALGVLHSQRAKRKADKLAGVKLGPWVCPVFTGRTIVLSETNITLDFSRPSPLADVWVRLYCLGRSLSAWLPAHRYEYLNEFLADGWTLNKSASLRLGPDNIFYVDITLEKPAPAKRTTGRTVGADLGYRKALVTSDGTILGADLPEKIATICSKQHGSKAHHRAVVEKNQYIRTELNRLDTSDLQTLVVEDLFQVFHNTKIGHKVMNRLQYWSYAGALKKLADRAERECFTIARVNPAYTSQRCSQCGWIDPHNRKLEVFKCVKCHYTADADLNASLNILARYEAQELTVPEIKEINNVL
jgi:putative transposase